MKKTYTRLKAASIRWRGKRIVGCQSNNHSICYGELWQCSRCHKIVCYQEGSDDLPNVCDDCWKDIRVFGHQYSVGVVSTWKMKYFG